jgi:hypothetical protein
MARESRITIAVSPPAALALRPRLFASLSEAFPVTFTAEPGDPRAEGQIVFAPDVAQAAVPATPLPTFVVASEGGEGAREPIELTQSQAIDGRLRGLTLHDRPAGRPLEPVGEALATAAGQVVWARDAGVDRVRSVLPELADGQVLYALLSQRAIAAVALIEFLRACIGDRRWRPPDLRASFVFDDPNLRWRTYGHIDYRDLVAHADAHGYHAVMAMIPLDASFPHRPTVALFAERSDRLSLVFHGNDHLRAELLEPTDEDAALAMAAQAIRRVTRFERRYGLAVDRIMMPPHGRCSRTMARALGAVGFDALCAIHPAPWTEERPASPPLVAWNPSEFVDGCAVIPRDALSSTDADLGLRAYLDHPVVVYGHHEDVAGGLDCLADAARRINGLGEFRWTSVGEIALTNFLHRTVDGQVRVRAYSRRIRFDVPEGAEEVVVEAPGDALGLAGWSVGAGPVLPFDRPHALPVGAPSLGAWPRVRRAATELRDRAAAVR